jgi:hypothetical protein
MAIFGFNNHSLRRHKVKPRECMQALADPNKKEAQISESKNGNPTIIWIGGTMAGRLLEVGVEYLEDMDWIFHANFARSHYKKLYENK